MAMNIVPFNPDLHQKVRYNGQLYAVMLPKDEFLRIEDQDEVVIHFLSHEKILARSSASRSAFFSVKKRDLVLEEPHMLE